MELGIQGVVMLALTCAPIAIACLTARRNAFIALITLLYILFVQIGLYILFVSPDYVQALFGSFRLLENVDRGDIVETSLIVTVGLGVAAACSWPLSAKPGEPIGTVAMSDVRPDHLSIMLLILSAAAGVTFIATMLMTVISMATEVGYIPDFLTLRRMAGEHYLLILAVFNLLPMATLYLLLRSDQNTKLAWLFWGFYLLATIALFLTFQKRPLVVFLAVIAVMSVTLHVYRVGVSRILSIRHLFRLVVTVSVPVVALGALYFVEMTYGRGVQIAATPPIVTQPTAPRRPAAAAPAPRRTISVPPPLTQRLFIAGRSAVSRTLGRMALSSVMLVSFVPEERPHYGFSNVGLLAKITGSEFYNPGGDAFQHFQRRPTEVRGNISTPALIDFYGQFGWPGVVIGSALIGIGLGVLARLLNLARRDRASYLFLLAAGGLTVFYLSQASVFRTALGYGGAIFLLCWLIFFGRPVLYSFFGRRHAYNH